MYTRSAHAWQQMDLVSGKDQSDVRTFTLGWTCSQAHHAMKSARKWADDSCFFLKELRTGLNCYNALQLCLNLVLQRFPTSVSYKRVVLQVTLQSIILECHTKLCSKSVPYVSSKSVPSFRMCICIRGFRQPNAGQPKTCDPNPFTKMKVKLKIKLLVEVTLK